jgi:transposase InsO family protein
MTPQNYYARRQKGSQRAVDIDLVEALVKAERVIQPRLGTRKLYHLIKPELQAAGVKLGRDGLFKILAHRDLLVSPKPAQWPKTTQVDRHLPTFKNLIKGRAPTGANQIWVADITYIRTRDKFFYLGLITDSWSRKIVGYHLGQSLEVRTALEALKMALKTLPEGARPIHHSDRGSQYASHAYISKAQEAGLTMSMTEVNHSAENAMAERINGILKQEFWLDRQFDSDRQAKQVTIESIGIYNTRRPHRALGLATPEQIHHAMDN